MYIKALCDLPADAAGVALATGDEADIQDGLAEGLERQGKVQRLERPTERHTAAAADPARVAAILGAVAEVLRTGGKRDLDADGVPKVSAVRTRLKFDVTAEEVAAAFRELNHGA